MTKARRAALKALAKLYAQVPRLACRGLCTESCGPIPMSWFEQLCVADANEGKLPMAMPVVDLGQLCSCPLLTHGRCSIYHARPLICRLWGAVDDPHMRCPYGCRPEPRYLTAAEGHKLLRKAEEISKRFAEAR